jgi:hypothetical protein
MRYLVSYCQHCSHCCLLRVLPAYAVLLGAKNCQLLCWLQVRQLLDAEGGPSVKVVAQIDTGSAIRNYDEILRVADAIMISRTNLGMVIRPEKVKFTHAKTARLKSPQHASCAL